MSRVYHKWYNQRRFARRYWPKCTRRTGRADSIGGACRWYSARYTLSAQRKLVKFAFAVKATRFTVRSLSHRLCRGPAFSVNISVVRDQRKIGETVPSFNRIARSALINYYELFECPIAEQEAVSAYSFVHRAYYVNIFCMRYSVGLLFVSCLHRGYAREFIRVYPRSSAPFNSLYSLSGTYIYIVIKPDIVLLEMVTLQYSCVRPH